MHVAMAPSGTVYSVETNRQPPLNQTCTRDINFFAFMPKHSSTIMYMLIIYLWQIAMYARMLIGRQCVFSWKRHVNN